MHTIYTAVGKKFGINKDLVESQFKSIEALVETNKISMNKFWDTLTKKLNISDLNAFKLLWKKTYEKNSRLDQKVVNIAKILKHNGYRIAILSNVIKSHAEFNERRGYYSIFSKVFLSYKLRLRKPNKKIYLRVANKLGVEPCECILIDDSIENVIGAKKTGMKAILFKNFTKLKKELKIYLI